MSNRFIPWILPGTVLSCWIVGFFGSASIWLEFDKWGLDFLSDYGGIWVKGWISEPPGAITGLTNKGGDFSSWDKIESLEFLKRAIKLAPSVTDETPMNTRGIRLVIPYWLLTAISFLVGSAYCGFRYLNVN